MEKPKTYTFRLYPENASDQILINYLKKQRNINQYLKNLIETDIEKQDIVKTIREVMEEYLQPGRTPIERQEKHLASEQLQTEHSDEPEFVEETIAQQPEASPSGHEDSDEVEEITPDALAFLSMFDSEE